MLLLIGARQWNQVFQTSDLTSMMNSKANYKSKLPPWRKVIRLSMFLGLKKRVQKFSLAPDVSPYVSKIQDKHIIPSPKKVLNIVRKKTWKKVSTKLLVEWKDLRTCKIKHTFYRIFWLMAVHHLAMGILKAKNWHNCD